MPASEGPRGLVAHKGTIIVVAAIIAFLVILWAALRAVLSVESPFFVVSSESMIPNLNKGDMVVIRNGEGFAFADLGLGDIIVFHSDDAGGRTVIHRIVEVYHDAATGERLVKTKGDNNAVSYEGFDYPIREEDYYGKVVFIVPKVGILSAGLNSR